MFSSNINRPSNKIALAALCSLVLATKAPAVTISLSLDPGGPVNIGQQFDVDLSVSGWNAADGGVDSIAFFVDFDTTLFSFVGGSGTVNSSPLQFLAEPNQGGGYSQSDDSSAAAVALMPVGRWGFGVSDVGDATAGSIGGADSGGALGSFTLEAIAIGTGSITIGANDVNQIFGDTGFLGITPTGGVTLGSGQMTVVPEPSGPLLVGLSALLVAVTRRRRR